MDIILNNQQFYSLHFQLLQHHNIHLNHVIHAKLVVLHVQDQMEMYVLHVKLDMYYKVQDVLL
jgi:hypothetical protein